MSKFTFIDLFAGVGGFRLALDKLGGQCVFSSEIDKFASKAYETLYGEKPFGDITKIDAKDIPNHDLLVAGIPCQAFSIAGKRKGFDDTRGTLFFDVARIAQEKQPKSIVIENVKGLVNHDKGNTLDLMVQTLNDIGYVVDFDVLNSKYFGVPQNRERIFIIAVRSDLIEVEPFSSEVTTGQTIVPKGKRRIGEWADVFNFDWPEQGEVTTRLRDILETEVDEKYYLDEEKTAKLVAKLSEENQREFSEVKNERIVQLNGDRDNPGLSTNDKETYTIPANPMSDRGQLLQEPQVLRSQRTEYGKAIRKQYEAGEIEESRHNMTELQPRKDGISNTLTSVQKDNYLAEPQMVGHDNIIQVGNIDQHKRKRNNPQTGRIYSAEGQSPTLSTMQGGGLEPKIAVAQEPSINVVGNLKPKGSTRHGQRDMVYGDNGIIGALNASDYKQPRPIAQEIRPVLTPDRIDKRQNGRRFKEDGEESFTLTSQDRHGVAIGDKPRYRIRKLTPLECFRLQAFPDEAHQALVDVGISDSQRYKMAGNAVTVNVIEAIGERLIPLISSTEQSSRTA